MPSRKSRRKTSRKSRRKTSRKSRRKTSRKSRRKTSRKSRRKTSRKSRRKTSRKSHRKTSRKSRRKTSRKSRRKTSRKSRRKTSRKSHSSNDAKIISYFKDELNKNKYYSLGGAWKHPITGNQVTVRDKHVRLLKQAKKELGIGNDFICKVKRSPTNKKEDLIKEIRAYVRCYEKETGRNQDLSLERLNSESVSKLKSHLKFYRAG